MLREHEIKEAKNPLHSEIILMDSMEEISSKDLRRIAQIPEFPIIATDFLLTNISEAKEIIGKDQILLGWRFPKNISLIDHHANDPRMRRQISATNLAIQYVQAGLALFGKEKIVTNHTDADSILASLILSGRLEPDEEIYGRAAIAADHTGEINPIADLLMALQHERNIQLSSDCLKKMLQGEPLPKFVEALTEKRFKERAEAIRLVESEEYSRYPQNVAYFVTENAVSGELLTPLLPEARVIIIASPFPDEPQKWQVRVRAGKQFPQTASLLDAHLEQFNWGGRWNGGNTKRKGGFTGDPEIFAITLNNYLASLES